MPAETGVTAYINQFQISFLGEHSPRLPRFRCGNVEACHQIPGATLSYLPLKVGGTTANLVLTTNELGLYQYELHLNHG